MFNRWFATIAVAALLVSMQAGRAEAVGCRIGCGVAEQTCGYNVKLNGVGCERACQEAYDPMNPNADEDFEICEGICKQDIVTGKDACQATADACGLACTSAALPSCANICGTDLFYCAAPILQLGQSTFAASGGLSGPLLAQGAQGVIDLGLCYTTPTTGFNDCMANLACNSICGNGIIEAGEECDDSDTFSGDGCSNFCQDEDADGDGILDDGSGNMVPGDSPCPNGVTTGCDDNCQTVANPGQEDGDSDLTGDACDMNCTGNSGGNTISGGVYVNSVAPINGLPDSLVAACKAGTTCCSYTSTDGNGLYSFFNLDDGTYDVTASAPGDYNPGPLPSPIVMSGGSVVPNVDFVMTGPQPIPGIVTISNATIEGGIPFITPFSPITLTIDACPGATVTWSASQIGLGVLLSGNMTETAPPGHFEVIVTGLGPLLDPQLSTVQWLITVTGCGGAPDGAYQFDAYIDPSGFTTYVGGDGAPGTTVTLYNSPSIFGPWTVVPNGSVIMSPSNRVNPDLSDAAGHFGWDVMAGYYKVIATKSGCTVESYAMTIPPEVTDLNLELDCPCIAPPRTDCLTAEKGKLTIKDSADDTKDQFQWKWTGGEDTSYAALGLPLVSTSYDVCVYTGGNAASLMELPVPAGWEASGTTGYKYGDKLGINDGVGKVQMKSGTGGAAKLQIKGKHERLPDPTLGSLPVPIIVQLQPSDLGPCFESEFATGDVDENSAEALKAKFP